MIFTLRRAIGLKLMPAPMTTRSGFSVKVVGPIGEKISRSEEHTSELQSLVNLVCRLLLEKKKKQKTKKKKKKNYSSSVNV